MNYCNGILGVLSCWMLGTPTIRAEVKPQVEIVQPSIGLAYLYIDVNENGKTKAYKTPNIKGSKAQMKREIAAYIKKYVPNNAKVKCKITLQYNTINKNTSMGQKKKNISGDGAMIHKSMDEVLHRLM